MSTTSPRASPNAVWNPWSSKAGWEHAHGPPRQRRLVPADGGPPLLVVATGHFVGEGFDCPALDTLFLAGPVSFKGRLVQYAGRVLRAYPGKQTAEVHDYHDVEMPVLAAALAKRAPGYLSLGFPDPRAHLTTSDASSRPGEPVAWPWRHAMAGFRCECWQTPLATARRAAETSSQPGSLLDIRPSMDKRGINVRMPPFPPSGIHLSAEPRNGDDDAGSKCLNLLETGYHETPFDVQFPCRVAGQRAYGEVTGRDSHGHEMTSLFPEYGRKGDTGSGKDGGEAEDEARVRPARTTGQWALPRGLHRPGPRALSGADDLQVEGRRDRLAVCSPRRDRDAGLGTRGRSARSGQPGGAHSAGVRRCVARDSQDQGSRAASHDPTAVPDAPRQVHLPGVRGRAHRPDLERRR